MLKSCQEPLASNAENVNSVLEEAFEEAVRGRRPRAKLMALWIQKVSPSGSLNYKEAKGLIELIDEKV